MLKMIKESGGEEQILDLVEAPEFILVQSCDLILRHRDLRNPDTQSFLQQVVDALKIKSEEKSRDLAFSFSREDIKEYISGIEEVLDSVAGKS